MLWLRSALFNVWFFGLTAVIGGIGVILRVAAPQRTLALARFWSSVMLFGLRVICGVRPVVTGWENLPAGPALIASEHQSAFDTVVWLHLVPRVSYIFKAELADVPLFGPLLVPAGQIGVDRGGGAAAMRSMLAGAERAAKADRQIVIFPEGTRVAVGERVKLRPGIAALSNRTGLPVVPVATDSGLLWPRQSFLKKPGIVHIWIGEPIPPGLPPAQLVAMLRSRWDGLHVAAEALPVGEQGVDNSVDASVLNVPRRSN